jgi:adenylate cyclase
LLYLFEDYGLDTDRRELYRETSPISVEPKVFDLLAYVIRNREHVVGKDDLIATIWNGRIVSESALTTCINAARTAIGDSGEAQRLIKTLPRKGIRFVGIVREEEGKPAAVAPTVAIPEPLHPSSALLDKPSIAVLPFVNMSGDPEQEYFSDGITEDIITDLSKASTLHVLSRNTTFTFKGRAVEIGEIAQRLKVRYVIEGSVRKVGGRVRITAQLIDADKDSHIWGERYDRELNEIFALQDEISQAIVAALKVRLLPEERKAIENRSTDDPKAYQLYLMGRDYYLRCGGARDLEIATRFGQRALEIDPNYARAWALIAGCQYFLHRRGKSEDGGLAAAEKALSLDPTLAEAHAIKGRHLAQIGCYDEALAAHEESLRLEPDSFDVQFHFGLTCMKFGRHEAAIEHLERAAQLHEDDRWPLVLATTSYRALGRHDEVKSAARRALERIEREIALRLDDANALVCGCCVLADLGEKERAIEWASRALIIEPDDAMDRFNLACAFAQMDEPDQALDLLESCLRKAPPDDLAWITRDPDMLPLHDHPRYQALIAREEARLAAARAEQVNKAG